VGGAGHGHVGGGGGDGMGRVAENVHEGGETSVHSTAALPYTYIKNYTHTSTAAHTHTSTAALPYTYIKNPTLSDMKETEEEPVLHRRTHAVASRGISAESSCITNPTVLSVPPPGMTDLKTEPVLHERTYSIASRGISAESSLASNTHPSSAVVEEGGEGGGEEGGRGQHDDEVQEEGEGKGGVEGEVEGEGERKGGGREGELLRMRMEERAHVRRAYMWESAESESSESRLQHTATHCNTLQHTATHCNTTRAEGIYVGVGGV